jgi:hypothetical protein
MLRWKRQKTHVIATPTQVLQRRVQTVARRAPRPGGRMLCNGRRKMVKQCVKGAALATLDFKRLGKSVRQGISLKDAFVFARALVQKRELREHFEPSNPAMAGGANVEPLLIARP